MITAITEKINLATGYLCSTRSNSGLWSDFSLPTGESDGWVTGYVGSVLASTANSNALRTCREVWNNFGTNRLFNGHGGWAYNKWSPEDADSTAWGIRFAISLGLEEKLRTKIALAFLKKHIHPGGGVSTFINENEIRCFLNLRPGETIKGWEEPHPCVTAAAAIIPSLVPSLICWLIHQRQAEGYWEGYWWSDPEYCTALTLEALTACRNQVSDNILTNAYKWLTTKIDSRDCIINQEFPEGSPFATALALRILITDHQRPDLIQKSGNLVQWLLEHQRPDGSWQPSARLRVPNPAMKIPEFPSEWSLWREYKWEFTSVDQHAVFTTATVLDALLKVMQAFASREVLPAIELTTTLSS